MKVDTYRLCALLLLCSLTSAFEFVPLSPVEMDQIYRNESDRTTDNVVFLVNCDDGYTERDKGCLEAEEQFGIALQ